MLLVRHLPEISSSTGLQRCCRFVNIRSALLGIAAGTTYGVAKKARLIAVKALDAEGHGPYSEVIEGLQWVVNHTATTGRHSIVKWVISHIGFRVFLWRGKTWELRSITQSAACQYREGRAMFLIGLLRPFRI